MSANLSVINFSVGGNLGVSGKITLSDTIKSSSTGEFRGIDTTSLVVSSTATFSVLPTSTQTPTSDSQLTTKIYVDTADSELNNRIESIDNSRKTYIDDADSLLDSRITSVDSLRKTYIDNADGVLDNRITSVDTSRKTYIDNADGVLDTRITSVDSLRKTYIDDADGVLDSRITSVDSSRKTYIDNADTALNTKIDDSLIRKPYYLQNATRTYSSELGISQFIELGVSIGNGDSTYSTILPDPNTCSGQIIYLWNNSTDSQGVGQTGSNKFIKAVANLPSFFIPINETYMLISKGDAWVVYVFDKP